MYAVGIGVCSVDVCVGVGGCGGGYRVAVYVDGVTTRGVVVIGVHVACVGVDIAGITANGIASVSVGCSVVVVTVVVTADIGGGVVVFVDVGVYYSVDDVGVIVVI